MSRGRNLLEADVLLMQISLDTLKLAHSAGTADAQAASAERIAAVEAKLKTAETALAEQLEKSSAFEAQMKYDRLPFPMFSVCFLFLVTCVFWATTKNDRSAASASYTAAAEEALDEARRTIDELKRQLAAEKERAESLERRLVQEISEALLETERAREETLSARNDLETATDEADYLRSELETKRAAIAELQIQLDASTAELKQKATADAHELHAECARLRMEITKHAEAKKTLEHRLKDSQAELTSAQKAYGEARTQLAETTRQLKDAEELANALREEVAEGVIARADLVCCAGMIGLC